jgi:hypothetical protein
MPAWAINIPSSRSCEASPSRRAAPPCADQGNATNNTDSAKQIEGQFWAFIGPGSFADAQRCLGRRKTGGAAAAIFFHRNMANPWIHSNIGLQELNHHPLGQRINLLIQLLNPNRLLARN